MKHGIIILTMGIIWLVLSSSHIPHLIYYYPFHELRGVKSLAEEVASAPEFIREAAGINNLTRKEMEESLTRELRIVWVKNLLLVLVGLITGIVLLKRKRSGRIIVLFIATGLIILRIIYFFKHWDLQSSPNFWGLFFKLFPLEAIQDITSIILLIVTIFLLTRPSIADKFRSLKSET